MLQQSEPLFISRPAGIPAGSMSPDTFFTIVMTACLFVDTGLVLLLINVCNSLGVPWVPIIVVAAFGAVMLALRVGAMLRTATQERGS